MTGQAKINRIPSVKLWDVSLFALWGFSNRFMDRITAGSPFYLPPIKLHEPQYLKGLKPRISIP